VATPDRTLSPNRPPRIGFVSLGCPKATVDSEHILTRLRAEGYSITPSYDGAELVIVNTCGFIDAAVEESLEAIGEALAENGRVIVTGCLGARAELVRQPISADCSLQPRQRSCKDASDPRSHHPLRAGCGVEG
jgi:ribosomal protein S12 methylthiotransferase